MGLLDDVVGSLQKNLDNPNVGRVAVKSSLANFDVNLVDTTEPSGFSIGDTLGKILKPKIVIDGPFGPITSMPYGEPPTVPWVGLVAAGLIIAGVVTVVYKLRNP